MIIKVKRVIYPIELYLLKHKEEDIQKKLYNYIYIYIIINILLLWLQVIYYLDLNRIYKYI